MRDYILVEIGGTLCMAASADGLRPVEGSMHQVLVGAGFDPKKSVRPFRGIPGTDELIDSIEFNADIHFVPLLGAVTAAINDGKIPVVMGGTDTLQYYAPLVAKTLEANGRLEPGSGDKVIFVSSMVPVTENAEHVLRILKAAHTLVEREKGLSGKKLTGAFVLSASDEKAEQIVVHDARNSLVKVSSVLFNAFHSEKPVGHVLQTATGSMVHLDPEFKLEQTEFARKTPSRVAAPLAPYMEMDDIIAYLIAMSRSPKFFDAVIIEGFPKDYLDFDDRTKAKIKGHLLPAIRDLHRDRTAVIINYPLTYSVAEQGFFPNVVSEVDWKNSVDSGTLRELSNRDVHIWQKAPNHAYVDASLMFGDAVRDRQISTKLHQRNVMALRYVPFAGVFLDTLAIVREMTKDSLVISGLPGNALPDKYVAEPLSTIHGRGTQVRITFDHDGHERGGSIEGDKANAYAATKRSAELSAGGVSPRAVIYSARKGGVKKDQGKGKE